MREIKFRAWDGNKMLPSQDLSQSDIYWAWLGKEDVELMQYTGLKDKNGKEIYEGDIVRVLSQKDSSTAPVVYHNCQFCFELQDDDIGNDPYRFLSGWKSVEVIGNIHENPELLEEK
mgnify:CR=1 FL=1|jgi:uncharacterized phage protein (TIGR01671 family)|tara:strand:+ start:9 stop:359 length:351 start_codon:yes stop_codon:yes gene_type:complete